jgi:hypothetical protein
MNRAELKKLLDKNSDGKISLDDLLTFIDDDAKAAFWMGMLAGGLGGAFIVAVLAIIF